MQERGIAKVDESELIRLCEELIAANPKTVADVKAGVFPGDDHIFL